MRKRGHPFKTLDAFITFLVKLISLYGVPFGSPEGITSIFSIIVGIDSSALPLTVGQFYGISSPPIYFIFHCTLLVEQ